MEIQIKGMTQDYGYARVVEAVLREGGKTSPRGHQTIAVRHALVVMENPSDCLALGYTRRLPPKVASAEALQLIGGVSYPELLSSVTSNFNQFREDGAFNFHGAYGPRLGTQLPFLERSIERDPSTRQAVFSVWDPKTDLQWIGEAPRDLPCTVYLKFEVTEEGRLDLAVHMRSNDAWLGLPSDVGQFGMLQCTMARALTLDLGVYAHHVDNLHVYERDWEKAGAIERAEQDLTPSVYAPVTRVEMGLPGFRGIGEAGGGVIAAQLRARELMLDQHRPDSAAPVVDQGDESWHMEVLAKHISVQ